MKPKVSLTRLAEEIENDIRSERQEVGPCYALERLQRALIIVQNKLWSKRVQISKELSYLIAKPLRSNKHVMELSERIELLLGMKERANGAYCRAYDCDMAIHIVNAQAESKTVALVATEQSHLEIDSNLDLSRLLSDMNRPGRSSVVTTSNSPICLRCSGMLSHLSRDSQRMLLFIRPSSPSAATMLTSQRDIPRRSDLKDQPNDTESTKYGKSKHKYDYEQGERAPSCE